MRPVIEARCEGATRCVTPRQTCPRPNGFGRNLRSKTRWFTDSVIHTKYHISQCSSSMREPRYPLPRVVFVYRRSTGPPNARRGWGARGRLSIQVFLGAFCAGAANRSRRRDPNISPDHSIGRSDGRCVQRAGT
ncbi:hypothetical protein CQW23_33658 [Capsicum baccatum]|uniref:Uncharacterized protein n=1 Tax=Capsicum baccatum TaxID=33114 RepID=A0A2G2V176_CAPBA|nr:hypothetical protein CQW23_33658 [Capsicum baccatum]